MISDSGRTIRHAKLCSLERVSREKGYYLIIYRKWGMTPK